MYLHIKIVKLSNNVLIKYLFLFLIFTSTIIKSFAYNFFIYNLLYLAYIVYY